MTLAMLFAAFVLCAAIIGVAGFVLTRSADRIGQATGLTGGWVGLALLATVTSLPELASGISAVALVASCSVMGLPRLSVMRVCVEDGMGHCWIAGISRR